MARVALDMKLPVSESAALARASKHLGGVSCYVTVLKRLRTRVVGTCCSTRRKGRASVILAKGVSLDFVISGDIESSKEDYREPGRPDCLPLCF